MMPVCDLEMVYTAWSRIATQGFSLYGVLLYQGADIAVLSYLEGRGVRQSGIDNLDEVLLGLGTKLGLRTRPPCALFLIDSLNEDWLHQWLLRAKERGHYWWHIFQYLEESLVDENIEPSQMPAITNPLAVALMDERAPLQLRSDSITSLPRIFERRDASALNEAVRNAAQELEVAPDELPCFVFFYPDLEAEEVSIATMRNCLSQQEVVNFVRGLFESRDFAEIVKLARIASSERLERIHA